MSDDLIGMVFWFVCSFMTLFLATRIGFFPKITKKTFFTNLISYILVLAIWPPVLLLSCVIILFGTEIKED